jgi:molybdopterin synthase sulfur carrier subunit
VVVELDIGLFAGLICNNPELPGYGTNAFRLEAPEGLSVRALQNLLALDPAMPLIVMVNNRHEQEDCVLQNGDRVALFPPLGGG